MNSRPLDAVILRYLGYAVVLSIAAYLVYAVRGVLPVFVTGGLIAYALEPVIRKLEDHGYNRRAIVACIFVIFLIFMALLGWLLYGAGRQIQALAQHLPELEKRASQLLQGWQGDIESLRIPEEMKDMVISGVTDFQQKVPGTIAGKMRGILGWTISGASTAFFVFIIIPLVAIWTMLEMRNIQRNFLLMIPPEYRQHVRGAVEDINDILGKYVRGQSIVCLIFGTACIVGFSILGLIYHMQYGLILGIVGTFLYIIPYFGIYIVAIIAGLLAYFTSTAPVLCAILVVAYCILLNLILDLAVAPRVLGEGIGLHPLTVLFAIFAGAEIGGLAGVILGVPVFASLRTVALRIFPRLNIKGSNGKGERIRPRIEFRSISLQPPEDESAETEAESETESA